MKYSIFRETYFSAAHRLRDYQGKCENLHGHNWRVRAYVSRESLNENGFVLDFNSLDKALTDIVDQFDHRNINDIPPFDKIQVSSENIAHFIFAALQKKLHRIDKELSVRRIMVWESEKSCAVVENSS